MSTENGDPAVVLAELAELNPEALLLEPRSTYDEALVGHTTEPDDHWPRELPCLPVAVYCYVKATDALVKHEGMTAESAWERLDHNAFGAWAGPHTPTVRFLDHKE